MSPLVPGWGDVMFTLVPLLILGGIAFTAFVAVRNYRAAKRGGVDPFAMNTELTAKLMRSDLLKEDLGHGADPQAAPVSIEERLAELDDLHARSIISADERAAARASILGG